METYAHGNYGPVSTSYNGHGHMNNNNVYTSASNSMMMTGQQPNRDALKRNLTLDLDANAKNSVIKKTRTNNGSLVTPLMNNRLELLQSPDLHMLKLGSPEIERLIMQQNMLNTPTNGGNGIIFPRSALEEQELYTKAFAMDAMSRVQQSGEFNTTSSSAGGSFLGSEDNDWGRRSDDQENLNSSAEEELDTDDNSMTSGSMMSGYSAEKGPHGQRMHPAYTGAIYGDIIIKQEPGVVNGAGAGGQMPTMSEMNPIDMVSQERIKLERKRQRNRLAASKCRKRKLERIAKLEDKVKQIKMENQELNSIAEKLRDNVKKLRSEIAQHTAMGCSLGNNYNL